MKVGGLARYFFIVLKENDLIEAISWAENNPEVEPSVHYGAGKIKWVIIGDGSNLVPSDRGFNGLVIKNEIKKFKRSGDKVFAGAGNNLLEFINQLNRLGLQGMEKMAGIPGTIGGAIYGSAGAYGQEIKDCLVKTKIHDVSASFNPSRTRWLSKKQCKFGYRESIFKKNKNWIILGAEFKFKRGSSKELQKTSKEIIKMREKKYWPGLLCPGSFFKNVVIKQIRPKYLRRGFLSKVAEDKIMYGKVPAGYLLEMVGAKGTRIGDIKVAKHHANLIYNLGRGKSSEITRLSKILKEKVKKRFGINLEEEIQYL